MNEEVESSETSSPRVLECDYDSSPTELYQAIEGRRWDDVIELLDTSDEGIIAGNPRYRHQTATWVVRKERNGRLRWRLLPIHAAIIFQAPTSVIESLLQDFPAGATAKDDQGMLPLHLALRNQPIVWETIEELLTAHPTAVFEKDRKGRTPIQSGLASQSSESAPSSPCRELSSDTSKAALSVLELFTSITVAGEKSKWKNTNTSLPADWSQRMSAMAQQHAVRLTELRGEFETEQNILQTQHEAELDSLIRRAEAAEQDAKNLKMVLIRRLSEEDRWKAKVRKMQGDHEKKVHDLNRENAQLRERIRAFEAEQQHLMDFCDSCSNSSSHQGVAAELEAALQTLRASSPNARDLALTSNSNCGSQRRSLDQAQKTAAASSDDSSVSTEGRNGSQQNFRLHEEEKKDAEDFHRRQQQRGYIFGRATERRFSTKTRINQSDGR